MESYTSGLSLHIHLSCILMTKSLLFDSSLVTDMKWLCRSRPVCSALVSSLKCPIQHGLIDLCVGSMNRDLRADLLGNTSRSDAQQEASVEEGYPAKSLLWPLRKQKILPQPCSNTLTWQNTMDFSKGSLMTECTQCNRFTTLSHSRSNLYTAATLNCGYCVRDLQKVWQHSLKPVDRQRPDRQSQVLVI